LIRVTTIPTPLELRTQEQRDAELVLALQSTVMHAKKNAPYYAASLADIEVSQIREFGSALGASSSSQSRFT
jgi:hypothetical protein